MCNTAGEAREGAAGAARPGARELTTHFSLFPLFLSDSSLTPPPARAASNLCERKLSGLSAICTLGPVRERALGPVRSRACRWARTCWSSRSWRASTSTCTQAPCSRACSSRRASASRTVPVEQRQSNSASRTAPAEPKIPRGQRFANKVAPSGAFVRRSRSPAYAASVPWLTSSAHLRARAPRGQVVNCKDELAQPYLLDAVIQARLFVCFSPSVSLSGVSLPAPSLSMRHLPLCVRVPGKQKHTKWIEGRSQQETPSFVDLRSESLSSSVCAPF